MTKESTTDINHHFTNTGVVQPPRPNNNPGVAAKVFEDVSLTPVTGAKVIAVESGKTIETAYTADDGTYVLTKVVAGHTYTYTASKTGYTSLTKTALYDGATTLPLFGVVKK